MSAGEKVCRSMVPVMGIVTGSCRSSVPLPCIPSGFFSFRPCGPTTLPLHKAASSIIAPRNFIQLESCKESTVRRDSTLCGCRMGSCGKNLADDGHISRFRGLQGCSETGETRADDDDIMLKLHGSLSFFPMHKDRSADTPKNEATIATEKPTCQREQSGKGQEIMVLRVSHVFSTGFVARKLHKNPSTMDDWTFRFNGNLSPPTRGTRSYHACRR